MRKNPDTFVQSVRVPSTQTHTDHVTCGMCSNSPHRELLSVLAMPANNNIDLYSACSVTIHRLGSVVAGGGRKAMRRQCSYAVVVVGCSAGAADLSDGGRPAGDRHRRRRAGSVDTGSAAVRRGRGAVRALRGGRRLPGTVPPRLRQ